MSYTIRKLRSNINKVEKFDYSEFSKDKGSKLQKLIKKILKDSIEPSMIIEDEVDEFTFYRCRENTNDELYTNVEKLWHPPKEKVTIQRFNLDKNPIVYCGTNLPTAMIEIEGNKCRYFTSMKFKLLNVKLKLIELGLRSIRNEERKLVSQRDKIIHQFLSKESKKKVNKNIKASYLPLAYSAHFIRNNEFDAFVYESVATNLKGINIAFKPEYLITNIVPVEFRLFEVTDSQDSMNFTVKCRKVSKSIEPGLKGNIEWEDVKNCSGHLINSDSFNYENHF